MFPTPTLPKTDFEERLQKRRRLNETQEADGVRYAGTASAADGCSRGAFVESHTGGDFLGSHREPSSDSWFYDNSSGLEPGPTPPQSGTVGQTHWIETTQEDLNLSEQVCFGMVTHLSVVSIQGSGFEARVQIPVVFEHASGKLLSKEDNSLVGVAEKNELHFLRGLSEEHSIDLQLLYNIERNRQTLGGKASKSKHSRPSAYLSAIIYGPLDLFDDVGKFVEEYEMYLQDPRGCDRNVRYRNPHRLSGLDPDPPVTLEFAELIVSHERVVSPVDLLAGLESDEALPDTEAPSALRTALYKHQKQALSFMLRRERGWALRGPHKDVWSAEAGPSGSTIYTNNITQDIHDDAPLEFRGGILADHMGLGKTLSMISLIASDFLEQSEYCQEPTMGPLAHWPDVHQGYRISPPLALAEQRNGVYIPPQLTKTTLLIVPSSLLASWEGQLMKHLHHGTLRWAKHHGSHKLRDLTELHQFNIVISTFQTVSSEFRRQGTTPSILFRTSWHRLVLDEAHCIRNRNTITTKAVCAIQATSRWAVTGTPLQNRLTDFASILQFLQVFPYSDHKVFESHIIDVWKAQGDEAAIERLKKLVKCLTLRRPKAAIELPERTDTIQYLDFSPMELVEYRQAESPIAEMLDDAINAEARQSRHALAKINTLRKFCNLGLSIKPDGGSNLNDPRALAWNSTTAQEAFENLVSLERVSCVQCCTELDIPFQEELSPLDEFPRAYLTSCLRLICDPCFQQTTEYPSMPVCVCEDPKSCRPVSISTNRVISSPATPNAGNAIDYDRLPTKIKALIIELQGACFEKSVIFSSWTTTLNLVQSVLDNVSIPSVRVDGRVSAKNRAIAFDDFRTNPDISVILLTISCGAEGLDLTAASRAYLMEPQWNPTIEEQALARVHRLGQTREVTTVRFIMKGSIEDHVINIQDRKKHLADLLLSSQQPSQFDLHRSRLQHLRSLLG